MSTAVISTVATRPESTVNDTREVPLSNRDIVSGVMWSSFASWRPVTPRQRRKNVTSSFEIRSAFRTISAAIVQGQTGGKTFLQTRCGGKKLHLNRCPCFDDDSLPMRLVRARHCRLSQEGQHNGQSPPLHDGYGFGSV
jgi:hypothetical protein